MQTTLMTNLCLDRTLSLITKAWLIKHSKLMSDAWLQNVHNNRYMHLHQLVMPHNNTMLKNERT